MRTSPNGVFGVCEILLFVMAMECHLSSYLQRSAVLVDDPNVWFRTRKIFLNGIRIGGIVCPWIE